MHSYDTDIKHKVADQLLDTLNQMVEVDPVGISAIFRPIYPMSSELGEIDKAVVYATPGQEGVTMSALSLLQSFILHLDSELVIVPTYMPNTGLISSFVLVPPETAGVPKLLDADPQQPLQLDTDN